MDHPVVVDTTTDPEIYWVFMDLFSHSKKIIPLLLRQIPIFDLSALNNIYNWKILKLIDPFYTPWLMPLLTQYKSITNITMRVNFWEWAILILFACKMWW